MRLGLSDIAHHRDTVYHSQLQGIRRAPRIEGIASEVRGANGFTDAGLCLLAA
jgi:hypothetical protein